MDLLERDGFGGPGSGCERHHARVYLTLDGSSETARVLPTLLRRLSAEGYGVSVPLETRL